MATPEQIKAAHEALGDIATLCPNAAIAWHKKETLCGIIRAVLPPLPEPERPRITPARELAKGVVADDDYAPSRVRAAQRAIERARAEIIALLEWEMSHSMGGHYPDTECSAHGALRKLLAALREPDEP